MLGNGSERIWIRHEAVHLRTRHGEHEQHEPHPSLGRFSREVDRVRERGPVV